MIFKARQFFQIFDMAEVWANYRRSMRKRRAGSELEHNNFGRYARRACSIYGSVKGSAILGQLQEYNGKRVFAVSHYAPSSNRDGLFLLQRLAKDSEFPAVLAVTEDMAGMLEKAGFRNTGITHPSMFRGNLVMKHIFINWK